MRSRCQFQHVDTLYGSSTNNPTSPSCGLASCGGEAEVATFPTVYPARHHQHTPALQPFRGVLPFATNLPPAPRPIPNDGNRPMPPALQKSSGRLAQELPTFNIVRELLGRRPHDHRATTGGQEPHPPTSITRLRQLSPISQTASCRIDQLPNVGMRRPSLTGTFRPQNGFVANAPSRPCGKTNPARRH